MLPSFRLVLATFVCSFLVVFASLRLMESAHIAQATLSTPLAVMPSADAPFRFASAADRFGTDAAVPAIFDLRFAAGVTAIAPIPASLTLHAIDRATRAPVRDPVPAVEVPPVPEEATPPIPAAAPAPLPAPAMIETPAVAPAAAEPAVANPPAPATEGFATQEPVRRSEAIGIKSKPDVTALEPVPVARIEIAALPDADATPFEPPSRPEEYTAAIDPDRKPPEPVETAGTTQPAPVKPAVAKLATKPVTRSAAKPAAKPQAKPKAAPAAKPAAQPVRRRAAAKRTAPAAKPAATPATSPFSSLFGSASQTP